MPDLRDNDVHDNSAAVAQAEEYLKNISESNGYAVMLRTIWDAYKLACKQVKGKADMLNLSRSVEVDLYNFITEARMMGEGELASNATRLAKQVNTNIWKYGRGGGASF